MSSSDSKDDKDMTMAEREQWLRDRGVQIENPRDRAQQAAAAGTLSITQQIGRAHV